MATREQRALNSRQIAFAHQLVEHEGNATKAAEAAGYSPVSAGAMGATLRRDPRIKELLRAMTLEILADAAPEAAMAMQKLLVAKSSAVRLGAARDILDRNQIGVTRDVGNQQALVVNISLGDTKLTRVIEQ